MDCSTTYTTARTSHGIPKQIHKGNLDPLRYKVEEIPSYVSKPNHNHDYIQTNQQIILYNPYMQKQYQPTRSRQNPCLQTHPMFHAYQSKTPIGKPNKK